MRYRLSRAKRIMNIIFMRCHRGGYPRAEFLKKAGIFEFIDRWKRISIQNIRN